MFWRKANAAPRESETLRRAREQFGTGDAQSALGTLQQALTEQPEDRAAYAFAAELLAAMGAEEEAALFQAATQSEPLQALFDLGMHFAEADQPLAEPFLQRAFELSGHPIAALALAETKRGNFQIEAAAEVLRRADPLPYWGQVELARTELMLGPPDRARQLPREAAQVPVAEREHYATSTQRLSDMLARFEAATRPGLARPLAEWTIREWHFVQYGAAILDYMDERVGAGALEVAGGRYVYQSGGTDEVALILHKLRQFLQDVGQVPPVVWAVPERDSEVLGRALASLLGVPLVTGERPQGAALIVAADSKFLLQSERDVEELGTVRPGQVVFAYTVNWVDAGNVTPDVAGLLSQMYVFPWAGGQMRLNMDDPEKPQVEQTEPDLRPAEAIAQEVLAATPGADPGFEETLAFYRPLRGELSLNRTGTTRWPFLRESPVPGTSFGAPGLLDGLEEAET